MAPSVTLGLLGALLVLAFLANRFFRVTRIPDVVLLMLLGVLLGPGLHLLNAERLSKSTSLLGTLAIILVLFEGGLELNLRNTIRHFPGGLLFSTLGYLFSASLVALIVVKGLHLPISAGLLCGAALGCTSSAVVLPVLQQLHAEESTRATLVLEASWGDVLAVLTVGLLLELQSKSSWIVGGIAHGLSLQVGLALVFSICAGILWSRLLPVLSEERFWQVLTFSVVLVLYAGMEALGANGLIAVLAFGLAISNFPGILPDSNISTSIIGITESQTLLAFHSELSFLVRTFFFVLIGAVADLHSFREHPLLMLATLAALLIARWLAVQSSRWSWKEISVQGRELIMWMLPRGLITVVLAIQIANARTELAFLPGLAFAIILVTNLGVIVPSVRARKQLPGATAEDSATTAAASSMQSRRWLLDALLLVMLTAGGVILWYGNLPPQLRPAGIRDLIRLHLHKMH